MQKIKNIKTSRSFSKTKDFITSLKSKKRFHLQLTDWTQLKDVKIKNSKEVLAWRKAMREFVVDDSANEATERSLEKLIKSKPEIICETAKRANPVEARLASLTDELRQLERIVNQKELAKKKEKIEEITKEECFAIFKKYKADILMKNGIAEYNLKKVLLEEAIDRKLSNGDSSTPLLDQDSTTHSHEELQDIIDECKDYFKSINELYTDLNKEERRVYNMTTEELNEWLKLNGYRYRCKE